MKVQRKSISVLIIVECSIMKWRNIESFMSMSSMSKRIYLSNLFISHPIIAMDIPIKISPYKHSVNSSISSIIKSIRLLLIGSVPINCTIDFGDGHHQTNGTNRHQYYTAFFSRNYTRYGQYNVSIRCYNELSTNTTQITRVIRRENMNRKMILYHDLMETSMATRFNLFSREDYSFRHSSCLHLRNPITEEKLPLIWRKKSLEVIPTEVRTQTRFSQYFREEMNEFFL